MDRNGIVDSHVYLITGPIPNHVTSQIKGITLIIIMIDQIIPLSAPVLSITSEDTGVTYRYNKD